MNNQKWPSWLTLFIMAALISLSGLVEGNMKTSDFFSAKQVELIEAVQSGDEIRAKTLLDSGLNLNVYGEEGITPLFWFITQNDKNAIELALKLGADPNLATTNGRTPVAFVTGGNDDQLLKILLENGGDPNSRNADNQPAIFAAIGQERLSQIEMLIEFGADLNLTDGPNRNSAHYAAFLNKYKIVYYLIDQGADHTNRNSAGGDIAWLVHEGLSENLLSPQFPAYEWAKKVKEQLQDRGVNFPPPSPKEVRQSW